MLKLVLGRYFTGIAQEETFHKYITISCCNYQEVTFLGNFVFKFCNLYCLQVDLPELDNPVSEKLRNFVSFLMDNRPGGCSFLVIKEESKNRLTFFGYLIEDRTESTMSYYEFLQHIQKQVKSWRRPWDLEPNPTKLLAQGVTKLDRYIHIIVIVIMENTHSIVVTMDAHME